MDGNCVSVPACDRDRDTPRAHDTSPDTDAATGAGDVLAFSELAVKTSLHSFAGEDIYKMSAPVRGICLIVNNIKFQKEEWNRSGAEKDGEGLREVFQQLGFSVHYLEDLTANQMISVFEDYAQREDHKEADCFVSVILTHGWKENALFGVDNLLISLYDNVVALFNNENCPGLMQKPKLFFVQACRGELQDKGVSLMNVADAAGFVAPGVQRLEPRLPSWSDTLICFSTIDGYVSLRNVNTGSWFADALIRTLCEHACDTELHALLTKVNVRLMQREGSSELKQSLEKQYRGWSRAFYFNPGHYSF